MKNPLDYYLVGKSSTIARFNSELKAVAPTTLPLFFWGEPGTGLTFYAKAVHTATRTGKFIPVFCFSLEPETAKRLFLGFGDTPGWLEEANEGTIFLKRITECPLEVQETLERIIGPEGTDGVIDFVRVNSTDALQSKVRFMASMVGDLDMALEDKVLHSGLFELFKNHGKVLHVPPLRERREDVPEIVDLLVKELNIKYGKKVRGINSEAMEILQNYDWRGNMDELTRTLDTLFAQPEIENGWITSEHIASYLPALEDNSMECFIQLKAERFRGRIKSRSLTLERDFERYKLGVGDITEVIRVENDTSLTPTLKYFTFKLKDGSQIIGKILDDFIEVETSFSKSFRFRPPELWHLVIS